LNLTLLQPGAYLGSQRCFKISLADAQNALRRGASRHHCSLGVDPICPEITSTPIDCNHRAA
jgi:hypothetical protein